MYDHYIAVDWAQCNMAIARMTAKSNEIKTIDTKADVGDLRAYLKNIKGKKILTIEETTTSQWLYSELKDNVDEILICDPHRNKLLSEGAKTDKIDCVPRRPSFQWVRGPPWQLPVQPSSEECIHRG